MCKKLTIDDCKKHAKSKGGVCLSKEYKNNYTKMLWECREGHQWEASFSGIKNFDYWCLKCYHQSMLLTIEDCIKFAKEKNGKCLSKEYIRGDKKLLWGCEKGHIWEASFTNIRRGSWCKKCAIQKSRLTLHDCLEFAHNKEGKCLSNVYKNNITKMLWECENQHRWEASFNDVRKCWCPKCSGVIIVTIEDCYNLATNNNGKCLSNEYKNAHTKMLWECQNKHQWEATCHNIKSGKWCPKCSLKKSQKKLTSIVEEIFPNFEIIVEKRFKWLGLMSVDIYIPKLKLAIEYDGEQHFKPVRFGGMPVKLAVERFKEQKKRDKKKNKLILKHKESVKYFIRISYTEKLNKKNIIKILKTEGLL